MIKLKNVSKFYYSKGVIATGFAKVNLDFAIGEFVAITGESGSGKSTLLNVISGLDTYEEGEMYINGKETSHYLEKDWEKYRRENIGNIYQNFNLINSYTVYQNIELVLTLNGVKKKDRREKINTLLKEVDLEKFKRTKVSKLSGGQKQRVAIARALAKETPIIIADEPTGNLDKRSAEAIIKLLSEVAKDKLVIIVTHNYEQVEPYVTRKITMHDGRVLEDKKIKDFNKIENYKILPPKEIKLGDKIILGFRNTFNIIPKFILLLLVYAFVVASLMAEYSFFRKEEYEAEKNGENYVFNNVDDKRIILTKKDRSAFSQEEITNIEKHKNIDHIMKNDFLVDEQLNLVNKESSLWITGNVDSINNLKGKVDVGRKAKSNNEIVILGQKEDYYLGTKNEELLNGEFYLSDFSANTDYSYPLKIVGIKYLPEDEYEDYTIYLSDEVFDKLLFRNHLKYSSVTIDFMNKYYNVDAYDNNFKIVTNERVPEGEIYISSDLNYLCPKEKCLNQRVNILVDNIYFTDQKELLVTKSYDKDNFDKILNIINYRKNEFDTDYNGCLYVNSNDYNKLFNHGTYQMSVFVDDVNNLEDVAVYLEKNYKTIVIKDTLSSDGLLQLMKILKTIFTVILVIVLFFIAYFVIRLILKSRNIYFSIIRMLGGTKKTARDLLIIELFTVSNLAYFFFVGIAYFNKFNILKFKFLDVVNRYFLFKDYVILYLIICLMSYLISLRYARKLFKNSVMNTYREEV